MKTVSILGASGFLGGRLHRHLRERVGDRFTVTGTGLLRAREPEVTRLDVTDTAALTAHLERGYDYVVFAAGTKDIGRCERELEWGLALNARPLEEMAAIVKRLGLGTRIIYLSTDYVFDGVRGGYAPGDPPDPRTNYGRSKLLGEQALLAASRRHKIVRSGGVLGRGATFYDWLLGEIAARREVALFDDCFNTPTPAGLLAELMVELLDAYDDVPDSILHFVGDRRMSRYEVGCAIAGASKLDRALLRPVARPAYAALFQRDLSLVPSEFARLWMRPVFADYLEREAAGG